MCKAGDWIQLAVLNLVRLEVEMAVFSELWRRVVLETFCQHRVDGCSRDRRNIGKYLPDYNSDDGRLRIEFIDELRDCLLCGVGSLVSDQILVVPLVEGVQNCPDTWSLSAAAQ